jgi:hypothetical protein
MNHVDSMQNRACRVDGITCRQMCQQIWIRIYSAKLYFCTDGCFSPAVEVEGPILKLSAGGYGITRMKHLLKSPVKWRICDAEMVQDRRGSSRPRHTSYVDGQRIAGAKGEMVTFSLFH